MKWNPYPIKGRGRDKDHQGEFLKKKRLHPQPSCTKDFWRTIRPAITSLHWAVDKVRTSLTDRLNYHQILMRTWKLIDISPPHGLFTKKDYERRWSKAKHHSISLICRRYLWLLNFIRFDSQTCLSLLSARPSTREISLLSGSLSTRATTYS